MAIKLSECSPSLHAAIMAQLEREGRELPTTTVHYAVANYMFDRWVVGPETENRKLIERLVSKAQLRSPRAAYMAAKGEPLTVMVKLTRTTPAKGDK